MLFQLSITLLNIEIWKRYELFLIGLADFSLDAIVEVVLASNSSGEFHVLLLDGHSLCVDAAEVGVLENSH